MVFEETKEPLKVSFQFQMNKKEIEICECEMHLKQFFLRSYLSNYDIISA